MKKEQLEIYTSELEIELFKVAYDEIKLLNIISNISQFQSHCEFNLFWIYSIAPEVILHIKSIEFLNRFKSNFKRKLTVKELLRFDYLINWKKPEDFEQFKKIL